MPITEFLAYTAPKKTTFPIGPEYFVGRGVRLIGTSLGTIQDAEEAMGYAVQRRVKTKVIPKKLEDVGFCLDALEHGENMGRFVVVFA